MKILHIAHFDEKFIKVAADIFNSSEGVTNFFLVFASDVPVAQKFFANLEHIRVVNKQYIDSKSIIKEFEWCDCLVVHYLDYLKARVVLRAPKGLPIVWSGWGGDYYYLITGSENNLLGKKTQQQVELLNRHRSNSRRGILQWMRKVFRRLLVTPIIKRAIYRTNYFSSPFPEDYDLLKLRLGQDWSVRYVRVFYGSVKLTYMPGAERVYGNNILVGNSATPTNNHIEIFDLLTQIDLGERQIFVPLSYGDPIYRDGIIAYGSKLFGSRFQPIVDFMSLEHYNTFIAECSVVVMGHRRQQGGGNAVTMLYKGAKVFLDEANTVYQYLKSKGAFVYSLQELQSKEANVFEPLTEEQKRKNREVMEGYSGHDMVLRSVGELVELVKLNGVSKDA
jgi:dTDP-N-acetylfucosamine:lipid II N-acetylfucosaminyltransferase